MASTATPTPSFLWHDYETSGTDPRRDRPTQFACWRTDAALQPLGEPEMTYCQPSVDVLPDPDSCLLTGLLPDELEQRGLSEPDFAAFVHQRMSQPGTCNLGYNSMRFDDEVSRHLFWRQFRDPYAHEWAQGNSRFDLIDVLRMAYALRPQGLAWPQREDGLPSFKLEHLASANQVVQTRAHDATDDVRALVGLARLLLQHQPRLWTHALGMRSKATVGALLDLQQPQVLIHVSQRFAAVRGCLAMVLPALRHPRYAGRIVVVDLDADPRGWSALQPEEMAQRLYVRADSGVERLPIKAIHLNRAPMLAPLSVLKNVDTARIALNVERCLQHAQWLGANPGWPERLTAALQLAESSETAFAAAQDADSALYDGFVEGADRALCQRVLKSDPRSLVRAEFRFADARLHRLLWLRQARWFPQSLSAQEREQWVQDWQARLGGLAPGAHRSLQQFDTRIAELRLCAPAAQQILLDRLEHWREQRYPVVGAEDDVDDNQTE